MTLRQKAFKGIKWTSASAIISAGVQLLQVSVLARYLDKEDFGLMAIALFVIGISQIFMDMGLSNSIVYKQNVSKTQLSTLFWLNILTGACIFLLLILFSPLIAAIYQTDKLVSVINGVALTFLIIPAGQLYETLLKKDLQFKSLATRNIASKIVGLIVGVFLAVNQYGVFSLVFANLATVVVSVFLLISNGLFLFRPQLNFSWRSLKDDGFVSFGLYQMGENVIGYFNNQFDTLIIGKVLGMEALGMYNIAKTLAFKPYQVINPVLTNVAFPVLAKLQTETDKLKKTYLNIVEVLTTTNAPVYFIMVLWANPIIRIFFGPEWEAVVPVFRLLCITALFNSIGNPVGSLQLAKGRADLGFYWNLGLLLFMPLSVWIGSFWGLIGVTWGLAIFKTAVQYPAWRLFIYPLCGASAQVYFWSFGKPILLTILSSITGALILLGDFNDYVSIIVGSILVMLSLVVLNVKFNRKIFDNFKDMGGQNKKPS